ncbi:MAG: NAD(P)-dependent glycerol-3-phosphate dehydrogenase [Gammaproteobacteria bacterium]|nr:NAD(P)-dependent glycerol-3-phosphate dehydrogenase [Gammaproteobacteria bacterium]MDT8371904.1 NAD(P)H-dependent glycerol-3-phosphate dehydrogenase [Gammaproteobacteria bacterium]
MSANDVQLFPTTVVGAGAWGTALAIAIARNDHPVILWGRDASQLAAMRQSRSNERYLPGIVFPEPLVIADDFEQAVSVAKHVLVSVPSIAFSETLIALKPLLAENVPLSWATKGLMPDTGRFLFDTAHDILGDSHPLAIITGPSFAAEVAKGLPTAITVASIDDGFKQALASALHSPNLRAYTTDDVLGVQIGGSVKNVLAISAGIADGLGYGANARAALITRGLAEILRLAASLGARSETMIGLSGIGDLILTCTDDQSRNRQLGLAIGRGLTVEQAVAEVGKTVEGMYAAREVLKRAQQAQVEMPIVEQVCKILFEGYDPHTSVQELLCREQKAESGLLNQQ